MQQLNEIAIEPGATMPQLAIVWLLRLPQLTSVITGATCLAHLEDNLDAVDIPEKLALAILERINEILSNGEVA